MDSAADVENKKRTWQDRGSAEDRENSKDTKKYRGSVSDIENIENIDSIPSDRLSNPEDSEISDINVHFEQSDVGSDGEQDSVFLLASDSLSTGSAEKMSAPTEPPSDLVLQIVAAIQNPAVLKTISDAVSGAVVKKLKSEISDLKAKVNNLEVAINDKDEMIKSLQNDVHDLQQYSRRTSLRIFGFPEKKGENTDNIVLYLANKIGANVGINDIGRSHRVGKTGQPTPRAIIVRFLSYRKRCEMFRAIHTTFSFPHPLKVKYSKNLFNRPIRLSFTESLVAEIFDDADRHGLSL